MAKKKLTVNDIPHISVRELAYKIKSVDDYIGSIKGLEAADKRKPTLAFFLGAGASFESGIMTYGQMISHFKEKIFEIYSPDIKDSDEKDKWLKKQVWFNGNEQYASLFEKAYPTIASRQSFLRSITANKEPSFGYLVLADLLLRNYINTVLTTNLDDLVYIASTNFTGNRPIVYSYGNFASEIKLSLSHSKILKLHGDYLYRPLFNNETGSLNMERHVMRVLDNFGLVVVGYSGQDKSIMQLFNNINSLNGMYWCYIKGEILSEEVLNLIRDKDGRLIKIETFDSLMKEISDITDFRIDYLLDSFEIRKDELKERLSRFDSKYSRQSLYKYAEELKEIKVENSIKKISAGDYLILGNKAEDQSDFVLAAQYYFKAIELKPDYAMAYNNLGVLLDDESLSIEFIYLKAIEFDSSYAEAYANLGNYLAKDETRWAEAEKNFKKSIKLNPNLASPYYNLACLQALSQKEENKIELLNFLKKAIEINSKYKEIAKTDTKFDFVRNDPRFKELIKD